MRNLPQGYFKTPNFVFDLCLSLHALVILLNLLRRSNKKGECFPSLSRIRQDTGIKAENTVRRALKELTEMKLIISNQRRGQSTVYKLSHIFYSEIHNSDKKNVKGETATPSCGEGDTPSFNDISPLHEVKPKEYKISKTKSFKEKTSCPDEKTQDQTTFKDNILDLNIKTEKNFEDTNQSTKNLIKTRKSEAKIVEQEDLEEKCVNPNFDREAIFARSKLRTKNFPAGKKTKSVDEFTDWEINNAESKLEEIKIRNERYKPEVYNT